MDNIAARRRVGIVGAGITGPTAAICLAALGYDVTMFEAYRTRVQDAGSFLNLAPNGRAVLEQMGVADQVLSGGRIATSISFGNHRGRLLAENPEITTNLMRGELSGALRQAALAGGARIECDKRLSSLTEQPDGSWVLGFADGSTSEADIVLGCDGVWSETRRLLLPDAPAPSYTGVVGSGGVAELPDRLRRRLGRRVEADGVFKMTFGLRGFFGYQTVEPGRVWWFENHPEAEERSFAQLAEIPDSVWLDRLAERHLGDPEWIGAIITSSVPPVGRWPVHEEPALARWYHGSAAVLGDAAHAVAPHLGQGAALGIEDAYELALALHAHPVPQQAFAAYEAARRDRVLTMSAQARRTGAVMTPTRRLVRAARDLMLPIAIRRGVRSGAEGYSYRPSAWPVTAARPAVGQPTRPRSQG